MIACQFLRCLAKGSNGLVEASGIALAFAKACKSVAEIDIGPRPLERRAVPAQFL